MYAIAVAEGRDIAPVAEVLRAVELHLVVGRYDHAPLVATFVPEELRVAEVASSIALKHWCAKLAEGAAIVGRDGKRLLLLQWAFESEIVACIIRCDEIAFRAIARQKHVGKERVSAFHSLWQASDIA